MFTRQFFISVAALTLVFVTVIGVSGQVAQSADTQVLSAVITPLRTRGFSVKTIYRLFDLDRTISLRGALEDASEVRLSPDGRKALVLAGKAFGGEYRYAFYLYDLTVGLRWLLYESDVTGNFTSSHSWNAQVWSPDGTQLAYFHPNEAHVNLFDLKTRTSRPLLALGQTEIIKFMAWSPDGTQLGVLTREGLILTNRSGESPLRVPKFNGTFFVWSPSGRYLVSHNATGDTSRFQVIEAETGRSALPEPRYDGQYTGWSCDSERIVYTQSVRETKETSRTTAVFVLDIATNTHTRIDNDPTLGLQPDMSVFWQTRDYCDHFLLLGTPSNAGADMKLFDLDLSAADNTGIRITLIEDQAQLVDIYSDGSIVYKVRDYDEAGKPISHYFRYYGGVSRLLASSHNATVFERWWRYRWFDDDGEADKPAHALAVEADGFSRSPVGRLAWVNVADQSQYYLTTEGEIALDATVWR